MNLSLTEVLSLTGFPEAGVRKWVELKVIKPVGDTKAPDGTPVPVFDERTCFALYVAGRYWAEKAPPQKVQRVVKFLASQTMSTVKHEIEAGRSWPVPPGFGVTKGAFVVPPYDEVTSLPIRMAMRRLDLKTLLPEFRARVVAGNTITLIPDGLTDAGFTEAGPL